MSQILDPQGPDMIRALRRLLRWPVPPEAKRLLAELLDKLTRPTQHELPFR